MSTSAIPPVSTASSDALAALNKQLGATGGQTALGQGDFLNLLATQLKNQDPLQPMQNTDFIAQMANFSSLQQMQTLTQDFSEYSNNALVTTAQSYLGKKVTVSDSKLGDQTGIVTGIDASGPTPEVIVNGNNYGISTIKSIALDPAAVSTSQSN